MDNIKVGDLVETCSLMPGVVMRINGDDIEVRMLHWDEYDGYVYSHCSLTHCGVMKITAAQVLNRLKLGNEKLAALWRDKENTSWEKYNELVDGAASRETNLGPTRALYRSGSMVILMDRLGRIWLTKRKKFRHDNRRKRNTKVTFIPIKQIL